MLILVAIGLYFAAVRFFYGLSSITNLDDQHPWGIWIADSVIISTRSRKTFVPNAMIGNIWYLKSSI
jgi:Ni/Fe-hydrogenase subunit HybB-like protein